MTVDVGLPSSLDPRAQAALAVAAQHQASQAEIRAAVVAGVLATWASMNAQRLAASWASGIAQRIFVILSMGQETVASAANSFVDAAFRVQGFDVDVPRVNAKNFAGIASDGRSLDTLLQGALVHTFERMNKGDSAETALKAGANFLTMVAATQISDAGRAADQVAIAAAEPREQGKRKVRYGWVRMLTLPSCSRCVVLAGRFYKWNDGFYRHEMCDCKHIPAEESIAGDLTVDPYAYFHSLSREDQDKYFGVANARAIREGADIAQVVNATTRPGALYTADNGKRYTREGTTRRGFAGRRTSRGSRVLRPTPWQIYRDARGSREVAVKALREFGYIV